MSPSNRNRTLSFVTFAALVALTGCSSESSASAERATAAPIEGASFEIAGADVPLSPALRTPGLSVGLDASATTVSPQRVRPIVVGAPAMLSQRAVSSESVGQYTSPARPALHGAVAQPLRIEATPMLVVGTDACETDADCVPDGCHATSCVAAAEMAPGELECTADFRYGTTDGGGCLCHVGHCAAHLSTWPQGI